MAVLTSPFVVAVFCPHPGRSPFGVNPYQFLLVVLSLGCGSLPTLESVDLSRCIAASGGLLFGWSLLQWLASRNVSKAALAGDLAPLQAAKLHEKQMAAFNWLGLGIVGLIQVGFGWSTVALSSSWGEASRCVQAILLLTPAITLTVAHSCADHAYGVRMGYVSGGLKSFLRSGVHAFRSGIAWLTVPIVFLMAVADGITLLPAQQWMGQWALPVAVFLFIGFLLPVALRVVFRTSRPDPSQVAWIESLLRESRIRRMRIRRWETNGTTYNALVAGFVPPVRTLLISDRILDELPTHQMAMVILHEAAHVRRRHMPIRILAVAPAMVMGYVTSVALEPSRWAEGIGLIVGVCLTMLFLHFAAHRTEHDADVWACFQAERLARRGHRGVPDSASQAAEVLAAGLRRVTLGSDPERGSWLHPSVRKRIETMRDATACSVPRELAQMPE